MSEKPARQRLVNLNVHEVSIVDEPANEDYFRVIKRNHQEKSMKVTEIQKSLNDAIAGAMEAGDVAKSGKPADIQKAQADLVAACAKAKEAVKAMADAPPAAVCPPDELEDPSLTPTAKGISFRSDGSVLVSSAVAKSIMSSEQIASLKATAIGVMKALHEADIPTFKSAMTAIQKMELPKGISPPSEVRPTGVGEDPNVSNIEGVQVLTKSLETATKTIGELEARIKSIETARPAAQAATDVVVNKGAAQKTSFGNIL